ncbi:MAG TPA: hypothetical protein VHA06_07745 [Candidatus Angelobacter sp.]|jgi:hypothetical protein|nr:hypothetical protein [Candidatus Angelobacter sp.]
MAAYLANGIVWLKSDDQLSGFMHPAAFVQEFGKEALRALPRDIADEVLESFLASLPDQPTPRVDILKRGSL